MTIGDIQVHLSLSKRLPHTIERTSEKLRLYPRHSCREDYHKSGIIAGNAFK